jgi:polysaccharide biosynthesis transport protein
MKSLFERLRDRFDYIVVDLSPRVPIIDVRSALSSIDAVERAVYAAKAVTNKVIGVVLNKV